MRKHSKHRRRKHFESGGGTRFEGHPQTFFEKCQRFGEPGVAIQDNPKSLSLIT